MKFDYSSPDIASLEAERIAQQIRLDEHLSRDRRNEMGQFATPSELANDIAAAVAKFCHHDQIRFLEPALGTGAFYAALLRNFPRSKIVSAVGVELDSRYVTVAKQLWRGSGLKVVEADFMTLAHSKDHLSNLVLTNPPYVRHHHLTGSQKVTFQALASEVSRGAVSQLSGLYTYFVFAAHQWLAEDGIAAWLIPSEFMDVNYGESLRRYFSHHVSLLQIHRFDPSDVQFADALVSSAVVIFRRKSPSHDHKVQLSRGGSVAAPHVSFQTPLTRLRTVHKWSRLFATAPTQGSEAGLPLASLFTIKRGIATGANDFFILPRRELADRGIDERFVKPILPPARLLQNGVIESDRAGFPLIKEQLAVIDTDLPLDRIKRTCIGLWRYLQEGEQKGIQKAYLLAKRSPWYRQEQRPPMPFLCTYMGRKKQDGTTFRFFWNRSRATAANTYLLLYPVGPLKVLLERNPDIGLRVLELLNSLEPGGFTENGRVYGGGLFKMEPRELGRVDATSIIENLKLRIATQPDLLTI
jgi:predicted RNA methylase